MADLQKVSLVGNKDSLNNLVQSEGFQSAAKAVAGRYLTPERIYKMAALARSRQPRLGQCTIESFVKEFIKSCELGLDCGGATGQAYLVPFKSGYLSKKAGYDVYEAVFIPGYKGLIELVYRAKSTNYVDAQIVYAKDKFKYNLGSSPMVQFEPNLDVPREEVKCCFAVVRLKGSDYPKIEIMTKDQLLAIKARSRASSDGPWMTDEAEMMRKTVLRRALKYIPKTPELEKALEADNKLYDFDMPTMEQVDELPEQGVKGVMAKLKKSSEKPVNNVDIKKQIDKLKEEIKKPEAVNPIVEEDLPPWDGPREGTDEETMEGS